MSAHVASKFSKSLFHVKRSMFISTSLVVLGGRIALASGTVQTVPNASSQVGSIPIQYVGYGTQFPEGESAVQYLYGPEGTWKQFTGLENVYGYYNVPQSEQSQLISYANGTSPATCADPDNNVLFNLPYESTTASGTSFHEHNGRGVGGASRGQPFTQFWFDDNWVARYMAEAYGAPQPSGLFATATRWQILGLNSNNWPMPNGTAPDQLALMGLYYISQNNLQGALNEWNSIYSTAGSAFDTNNQRYTYSGLDSEYYLGLFKILTDRLLDAGITGSEQATLFQHSISLRSDIISEQQVENGTSIGWITSRTDQNTLINTETTAIQALALGASAKYSFEAGRSPMATPSGFFLRPYNLLSAVKGQSPTGYMVYGPYMNLPTGQYTVDFYMRSPAPTGLGVHLDVHDNNNNTILGTNDVSAGQFPSGYTWGRYSININNSNPNNSLEFRVYWNGQANLDVAAIRLR